MGPPAWEEQREPTHQPCSVVVVQIHFPDPEYAGAFQAYRNYLEDLAGMLGGRYGMADSLIAGVYQVVAAHPPVTRLQRRTLSEDERQTLDRAMRKVWGTLRRLHREVGDPEAFDEEANAWRPSRPTTRCTTA